jgi:60kDa lysophospholipase
MASAYGMALDNLWIEVVTDSGLSYTVLEFDELLDSSSIDSTGWGQIAETIFRNYTLFDGFVVLHGTDSLAYTCSALSFMLQNLGKPIIFTGTAKSVSISATPR